MNTQQQNSNVRGVRGNGNFRIATSEIKMNEPSEKHQPSGPSSSSSWCDFRGKARFNTPMQPILYHAPPCNNVERDNNTSDDGDSGNDDDDAIFYTRYEHDVIEDDDENNREFDSPKDSRDDSSSSNCTSAVPEDLWPSPSFDCSSPQLISRQHHLSSSLRAFGDLRLQSIEGLLVAQNQQQVWEETPEGCPHELLADAASEQPQQDDYEEKDPRDDHDKSDSSLSETRDSNQFSVEPIEMTTEYSAKCYEGESPLLLRRRRQSSSICCEPMVTYELFDSARKSQQQLVATSSESNFFFFANNRDHGDDDVMNIRSPVNQRPSASSSGSSTNDQQQENPGRSRQGWTPQQLSQYNEVLTFLQDACATRSPQISIPDTRLTQMEQLLRSLHPNA